MKNIIYAFCILLAGNLTATAQCDKKVSLTSSKTEYLDSAMKIVRSVDEKSVVEISTKEVIIIPGNSGRTMSGAIQSATCKWTIPYKKGKSVIKAKLTDNNEERNATITIEGKDGKLTLLFEVAEMPAQKIRVPIDTFSEKM